MSPAEVTVLMFGSFFVLLMLGVPLAWTTAAVGLAFTYFLWGAGNLNIIVLRIYDVMGSFSMIAIPLFVFMGNILQQSGIAKDLFHAIHVWLGRLKGGLGAATIVLCCILGAMIGTAGADITITGLICLPFMLQRGYDRKMALGSIAAGGALGVLIPPSIMFIIYGVTTGQSIGRLFMGGVGPGLLFGGLYIAYILTKSHLNPAAGPAASEEEVQMPLREKLALLRSLVLPTLLIVAVIGAIFSGIATPGEASGIGAFGALFCAAIRKSLTWSSLKESLFATMRTVGLIMWIVFGAMVFICTYTLAGGAEFVKESLTALPLGPWGILILMQLILLTLGMVLDIVGITVLFAPMFVPVIKELGFDPLWFGVLFNLNLQVAYLSPPFGYSLFYLKGVAPPDVTMTELYRASIPYIVLQLVGIVLCMLFPSIITWLPGVMIK